MATDLQHDFRAEPKAFFVNKKIPSNKNTGGEPKGDPSAIFQLATGYWGPSVLLAANELGVFKALADTGKSAREVASALGTDARATGMLLDACCGLGLLQKKDKSYSLSAVARQWLVPGGAGYLGSAIQWSRDQYECWGKLGAAVRQGKPVTDMQLHLGGDREQTRAFVLGMHERALGVARVVVDYLDLSGCRSVLDVGGGPATYAMLLARKYPHLQVTVIDLPAVVEIAKELATESGLDKRVEFRALDATGGDYGEGKYDAILFSGVLHQMSPPTIARMFEGAHRALVGGGRVIVNDVMLGSDKTAPAFSTLFSLQMLLTTREGAVFSGEECVAWLKRAGFPRSKTRPLPPPLPYTLVEAHKP